MIRVRKQTIKEQWKAIAYLVAQLAVLFLALYQLLVASGMILSSQIFFHTKTLVFKPSKDPVEYILFVMLVALLVALSFRVKKKQPRLFAAQKQAGSTIKQAAKEKMVKVKDKRAIALILIELMFVAVVVIAAYAFFEPNFALIRWEKANIYPPLTTWLNIVVAIVVLVLFYWIYSYTAWYRKR